MLFKPDFHKHLNFVWLNKKQNTREGISRFNQSKNYNLEIDAINSISREMLVCDNLKDFMKLVAEHENVISNILNEKPVGKVLFPDFQVEIKSLGAWGGDFIMTVSELSFEDVKNYFNQKGFPTVLPFTNLFMV